MGLLRTAPKGDRVETLPESPDGSVRNWRRWRDRPRRYVTLEGYAVEGGLDGPYQPSTCYRPTIALGRHAGPGDADDLWRDYERVLDLVADARIRRRALSVEWARDRTATRRGRRGGTGALRAGRDATPHRSVSA